MQTLVSKGCLGEDLLAKQVCHLFVILVSTCNRYTVSHTACSSLVQMNLCFKGLVCSARVFSIWV